MSSGVKAMKRRGAAGPRRKTGCYTCRARHVKCDEEKPKCGHCVRKGYECVQPGFIISSTSVQKAASTPRGKTPEIEVDNNIHPSSASDVFRLSQTELTRSLVPVASNAKLLTSLDPETAELLRVYQGGIATWMDLYDFSLTYQRDTLRLALSSALIRESICALSAKQLELTRERFVWASVAARRYGESLRLLIDACADSNADQQEVLMATILLSSVELLAAPGPDHKRHLYGANSFVKSRKIDATCKGIDRASFWIYARQDLAMSLMNECPTLLPPANWNVSWSRNRVEDEMGNNMVWLCSCVTSFVFGGRPSALGNENFDEFRRLMEALDAWFENAPQTCKGVSCGTPDHDVFEELWFPVSAAAAAMATYHEAKLLMLGEYREKFAPPFPECGDVGPQLQYHSMRIASIAISKISDGAFVNTLQPLYFAAKYVDSIQKKARIWSILSEIETRLGFHTASRIEQLQNLVEKGPV
ncbi:hypothetical protein F4805DRAFT_333930 [Annulohypoxylon moriforme]|nr:hypothetical protein F4805DRAFT_333930 [Annulohypoxylon moriforme]